MDFFEDLFDIGDHKRRRNGDGHYVNHREDRHDDYHEDEHHEHHDSHDSYDDHDYRNHQRNGNGFYGNAQGQGISCPSCSLQVMPGSKFCPNCGITLNVVQNCSSCGSRVAANAAFCTECGKKLR